MPSGLDAIVQSVDGDLNPVGASDDFQATVLHGGVVHGEQDGEVLCFPYVRRDRMMRVNKRGFVGKVISNYISMNRKDRK